MFHRKSFGTRSFSERSWKFDAAAQPDFPEPDADAYVGWVSRAGRTQIERRNRELIMAIVSIVTSGALECP